VKGDVIVKKRAGSPSVRGRKGDTEGKWLRGDSGITDRAFRRASAAFSASLTFFSMPFTRTVFLLEK